MSTLASTPTWPASCTTLEAMRAYHAKVCGGRWVESYRHGTFAGTGHYVYHCPDCGRSYETDSSD